MRKITINEIEISALENDCLLISTNEDYKNALSVLKFKHLKCNRIFDKCWKEFKRYESKCTLCNIDSRKKSNNKHASFKNIEEIQSKFETISKSKYIAVDLERDYKNFKSKIEIIHKACGNKIVITWNDFQQGHGCTHCKAVSRRLTLKEISNKINSIEGLSFIHSNFVKNYHEVTFKHDKCNTITTCRLNSILYGTSYCKQCRLSSGERKLHSIFKKENFEYESEVKYHNCRNKLPLPFDFKVNYKGSEILIEYDGLQHYRPMFDDVSKFQQTKINDNIKNSFAIENKIPLLRIKYSISDDELNELIPIFIKNVQRLIQEENTYVFFLE